MEYELFIVYALFTTKYSKQGIKVSVFYLMREYGIHSIPGNLSFGARLVCLKSNRCLYRSV